MRAIPGLLKCRIAPTKPSRAYPFEEFVQVLTEPRHADLAALHGQRLRPPDAPPDAQDRRPPLTLKPLLHEYTGQSANFGQQPIPLDFFGGMLRLNRRPAA